MTPVLVPPGVKGVNNVAPVFEPRFSFFKVASDDV
jgi:hypothetical protein